MNPWLLTASGRHFDLIDPQPDQIHILATERRDLMPHDSTPWECLAGVEPLPQKITTVSPNVAQARFIKRWIEVGGVE